MQIKTVTRNSTFPIELSG